MTLKELVSRVHGARAHTVQYMVDAGQMTPMPAKDGSGRRHYVEAHVAQLAARIGKRDRRRASADARRQAREDSK